MRFARATTVISRSLYSAWAGSIRCQSGTGILTPGWQIGSSILDPVAFGEALHLLLGAHHRRIFAGDLENVVALPRDVPKPQRLVLRPRQDALAVRRIERAINRASCRIGSPIAAPVAASQSLSVLSPDRSATNSF